MAELTLMTVCVFLGMCLSVVVWSVATGNGERTDHGRKCWWCGIERRSYLTRSGG
jgi:hypothetical protein